MNSKMVDHILEHPILVSKIQIPNIHRILDPNSIYGYPDCEFLLTSFDCTISKNRSLIMVLKIDLWVAVVRLRRSLNRSLDIHK